MSGLTLEQLAERKKGIGGSDASRVMSGDWLSLWREKTGRAEPEDLSGILAVQMGTCTEDLNHRWFERVTGREVLERSMPFVSADYPFMRMNADGITTTKQGHPAYWDAKHVGRLDEATVLRYSPQMTHCCTILGLDWWVLSVFIGNGKHEIVEQQIDEMYQASLIARERAFWRHVEADTEPQDEVTPVAPPKPQPKRREINLDLTPAAERPNWSGEFARLARSFAETDGAAKLHAITRKEMAELVPDDVGLCRLGLVRFKRDGRGTQISLMKGADDGRG
jgi:predicted phage-related endonuclease